MTRCTDVPYSYIRRHINDTMTRAPDPRPRLTYCAFCPPVFPFLCLFSAMRKDDASAASARERGNGHFKNGDFAKAIKYYEVAAKLGTGQVAALALQNAALCHLKVGAYAQCIDQPLQR